ncbi:hypothetical protein CEV31_0662 [Brucella thiophenivorans]|uniref:Uncharacterized protein n=1 Tax=Brucella thiophenivorans TaxID=571255 RepID=A0A256G1U5_9HYPH|nr:hypothetical protein CEV31_0662 [Brucella thiophenivorans]
MCWLERVLLNGIVGTALSFSFTHYPTQKAHALLLDML